MEQSEKKSNKYSSGGLPFDEDDFFISIELSNATIAQLFYYRTVILPELQNIVREHTNALIELGKEKEI